MSQTYVSLGEAVTKTDVKKLTDKEIDDIIKRYMLRVPDGLDATRSVKIRHIVRNARDYGTVYPFDPYWKTPKGINTRIRGLSRDFTYKTVNNAIRLISQTDDKVAWIVWITRPELSKTGPCPICAPRHLQKWSPHRFIPACPAHQGCCCELGMEYSIP